MFKLPDLPYGEDALAPAMSRETLRTHHKKHHAGYAEKTNAALAKKSWKADRLEDVILRAKQENDETLYDQAAQLWNHTFFWHSMNPRAGEPDADLAQAIDAAFGDAGAFRADFLERGEKHFGSGWLWLVADGQARLTLVEGHDADTPIAMGKFPILGCDLWEHAYYLDHKNERGAFLKVFIDMLANWAFAGAQLAAARAGGGGFQHPQAIRKAA